MQGSRVILGLKKQGLIACKHLTYINHGKTRVLLLASKGQTLNLHQLWYRCGATPQYKENRNGERVRLSDYNSLMISCNTFNFDIIMRYTFWNVGFHVIGETEMPPLQRNPLGS